MEGEIADIWDRVPESRIHQAPPAEDAHPLQPQYCERSQLLRRSDFP